MAPTPNPIDLTTLAAVKLWLQAGLQQNIAATVPATTPYTVTPFPGAQSNLMVTYKNGLGLSPVSGSPSQGQYNYANGVYTFSAADAGAALLLFYIAASALDQAIQDCITAFSAYVLRFTGRGPADGSIPAQSPFVAPVSYDEFYDGSGTLRQNIRNWPIQSVASVSVNGASIPQSTSINVWGFVIDSDASFISIRGGYSPTVATFQNYRYQGGRGGFGFQGPGFTPGIQNVEIVYTAGFNGTPEDLELAARKIVALNYKRTGWIGQKSQAMAQGAGTVTYGTWEMDDQDRATLRYYKRRVA